MTVAVQIAARTDVGRVRTNNEDAFVVCEVGDGSPIDVAAGERRIEVSGRGLLLALSDGMGGHEAGEVASALVIDSFASALRAAVDGSVEQRIDAAVQHAHAEVQAAARTRNKHGMGATLTGVVVDGMVGYVTQVGDSRAYLLRACALRQLTRDQSFVQMLVDSGAMTPEEARRSPRKNVILQAMGTTPNLHVATDRIDLQHDDVLLLCCDGLSNAVEPSELQDILAREAPVAACARLIALANARGGDDNLTAIVARLFMA